MSVNRVPNYETLSIIRLNKKRECKTTLIDTCDCCLNNADILIKLTKRGPNKTKSSGRPSKNTKKITLCNKHANELSNLIRYFSN